MNHVGRKRCWLKPYYQDEFTTIYCGDSRVILPTLANIDSLVTDPPYGINHNTDYKQFRGGVNAPRSTYRPIVGDEKDFDFEPLLNYRRVVLFGANVLGVALRGTLLIWDKRTVNGNKGVMADAEVAWLNKGHGVYIFNHTWDGFNRASERGEYYHPTQKPVSVMQWVIEHAAPKGLICDPYMGSGSTLIAARNLGYKAVGIEIDEEYCEIAVQRLLATPLPFSHASDRQLRPNGHPPASEQLSLIDGEEAD